MKKKILVVSLSPTMQKTLQYCTPWKRNEVNRTSLSLLSASGKGANTARILAQSGESVCLLSQSGGTLADFFKSEMEKTGVDFLSCDSGCDIRFCYTILEKDPYSATELVEEGDPVPPSVDKNIRKLFDELIEKSSMLVIAGSASPGFTEDIYLDFIKIAAKKMIPLVIDRHGPLLIKALETGPMIIKINMYEFLISYGENQNINQNITEESYDLIAEKGKELFRKYGHRFVLTNGEKDTLIIDGENISRITPEKGNPVNPIGCGDAVTAGVASGLNQGLTLKKAVERGMKFAAVNLEKMEPGTIF